MSVFIIAEAGSSHDNDLRKAYRLIEAAKECGADAVKFQWTSSGKKLAARRNAPSFAVEMYQKYLEKPIGWICSLKQHCEKVGIQFLCTTYLVEDVPVMASLVEMFKISAMESQWREFVSKHCTYEKPLVVSINPGQERLSFCQDINFLHCISKYPTTIDDIQLRHVNHEMGLSDHTANVMTGAAAAARKAPIIEAHIRLHDTDPSNPDYGHSLWADTRTFPVGDLVGGEYGPFRQYVQNIRTVERML